MPGELAQNRRYPDGLLRAYLGDDPKPRHVLIEIATYPERRAQKQALDDLTLAYSALGHLPELLLLVLRPKGKFRIGNSHVIASSLGLSHLAVSWRTVELWNLAAEDFLAEGDVGIVPWIPLMRFDQAPEQVLERCAERIEREAQPEQGADLQVISQVMTEVRYPEFLNLFGGKNIMIESPAVKRWKAEAHHADILDLLKDRFGAVPREVRNPLREIIDEKKLVRLNRLASKCTDLDAFSDALRS